MTALAKQDGRPTNERGWNAEETLREASSQPGRKFSKEAAGFQVRGAPPQVCGACRLYLRDPESEMGGCQVVEGSIHWASTSALYIGAEDEAEAVLKQDGNFRPGSTFTPPKPADREVAGRFDIDELWTWAEDKIPVAIEPKHNGIRAIAEKSGTEVRLWFEGSPDVNRLASLPQRVIDSLNLIDSDFVLDLDVGIVSRGARLPRSELQRLNDARVELGEGERIVLTTFDLPFAGEDFHGRPFSERRDALEEFFATHLSGKGDDLFELSPVRWVESRREFEAAVRWAVRQERSEGAMAKAAGGLYDLDGSTTSQAKLKRVAELKVVVLDVQRNRDGTFSYTAGLAPSEEPIWENVVELDGQQFIELGETVATNVRARPGDVLTVQVLELIPDGDRLVWSGATVLDRDQSLDEPFSSNQSIQLAERARVLQKDADQFLPATMPTRAARVVFVTTDPSPLELARDEALVGEAGRVFTEAYLGSLGIEKEDVAVIPAIPIPVSTGRPSTSEAVQWRGWVRKQLEIAGGGGVVVVALGRVARGACGELADFTLPHPAAVLKRGDLGEVARKSKAIKRAILGLPAADARRAPSVKKDEGESWERNWHEMFPPSGEGEFVLNRTGQAIEKGEMKFDGRAIHLLNLGNMNGEDLQWLAIAQSAPHIVKSAETDSDSKNIETVKGTYQVGVWRESSIEFFLKGSGGLTGRYLFARSEEGTGDRRPWTLRKSEDHTPIAEKEDIEKVLAELRNKRQKWLVWGKPGQRPQKINVRTGRVEKNIRIPIAKADQSKGIIYGVVLDPYQADLHGDWIPSADVEEAAHRFMERGQKVNLRHRDKLDAVVMESTLVHYPSEEDYRKAMAGEDHSIYEMPYGDQTVRSGTWILGVKVKDPKARKQAESGELDAFSIEGLGIRRPAKRSEVPRVRIIPLKPSA